MKPVASQADLRDGEMIACEVDGVDVLLCRVDGQYYAVSNRCSHAQQVLVAGKLKGHEINCPLHGARFDVDGEVMGGPAPRPLAKLEVTEIPGTIVVRKS